MLCVIFHLLAIILLKCPKHETLCWWHCYNAADMLGVTHDRWPGQQQVMSAALPNRNTNVDVQSCCLTTTLAGATAQKKTDGVKAVVTLSSSVAQIGRVSESARALDAPLGPFDRFQFAYKVSKTALNQGAVTGIKYRDHLYAATVW